ncbi:glucokinase [Parapedobacter tibetensis]|uniref:glucokinase n=1 Tax=Parapedobacter tibetensis TaxID=2972951 RepID=UPI00214DC77B|nr:glucokinase [Parapedobacter tibetensis]
MSYLLYLPKKGKRAIQKQQILAADIGGTKTSLGLFEVQGERLSLLREATFPSEAHVTFEELVKKFWNDDMQAPSILSIGVAGPVLDNKVKLTNLSWELDASLLERDLGIGRVVIINDLEATAYGMAGLTSEDIVPIVDNGADTLGNMAILAPGTGLGEAGLFWDGEAYRPFATEGGHSDFAPRTEFDLELWAYLKETSDMISWEHLVSGPGIYRIYRFLRDVKGNKEPAWLMENFKNNSNPAAVISHAAIRQLDITCITAMELFVSYMAREATSLVLKHKAMGGLILGGGIPPRIYPLLRKDLFRQQFIQNSRMTELLQNVSIKVILNSKAALIGAAYYGAYGQY